MYEGEGKFDLSKWNPDYFDRLRDFVSVAASHDIIVELTFFCATYDDDYWLRHPFHPGNNVNQLGTLARQDFNTLKNEQVVQFQKALIRKMVAELNEFDNLFYEISNEPWADNDVKKLNLLKTSGASRPEMKWSLYSHAASEEALAWQQVMASEIEDAEKNLHKKHLIAQNYCNYKQSLEAVDANIDIIHFHYAWPEAVALNYGWDRPIGFDESGFAGSADSTYLQQAWSFMLAGGAIFNNLDYSYYVGSEDGTGSYDAPGGGSKRLRQQLKILHGFMDSFDYINMQPDYSVIYHAPGMISQSLSQPGIQYAIFFQGNAGDWVKLSLPEGEYQYEWIAPDTGQSLAQEEIQGSEDPVTISVPGHGYRFALRILSR